MNYRMYRNVLLAVFLVVQLTVILGIVATYLAALSLGIDVSLLYFFLFVPIISFLSSLPISANGIRIAEGGFVLFVLTRDFRFACPRWHLYTPESRRAHEILFGVQSSSSRGRHLSPR